MLRLPWSSILFPYTTLFRSRGGFAATPPFGVGAARRHSALLPRARQKPTVRSEEHTSELESHSETVCPLLLEKKKISLESSPVSVGVICTMLDSTATVCFAK